MVTDSITDIGYSVNTKPMTAILRLSLQREFMNEAGKFEWEQVNSVLEDALSHDPTEAGTMS